MDRVRTPAGDEDTVSASLPSGVKRSSGKGAETASSSPAGWFLDMRTTWSALGKAVGRCPLPLRAGLRDTRTAWSALGKAVGRCPLPLRAGSRNTRTAWSALGKAVGREHQKIKYTLATCIKIVYSFYELNIDGSLCDRLRGRYDLRPIT